MKKLIFIILLLVSNLAKSQLISQHFSSTVPSGWSSTTCSSCTWILNYDGTYTSNYRSVYDATKYSARLPSATTSGGIYLYIPVTFTDNNIYDITFYTKRVCNISVIVNETANQVTPLSTETINNASCNSNFSTWYSWSFSYTATYSGSGYVQILINTVYGGPTSVYLDDFGVTETSALPISLLYFKGENNGDNNRLYWSTASEYNNDYFTLEKTVDGVYFHNIMTIKGGGTTKNQIYYEVYDNNVIDGINYYVLRQTDYDGRFKRSDILSIDNRKTVSPTLFRVVDLMGRDVHEYVGIILFIYSDGSIIKKMFY